MPMADPMPNPILTPRRPFLALAAPAPAPFGAGPAAAMGESPPPVKTVRPTVSYVREYGLPGSGELQFSFPYDLDVALMGDLETGLGGVFVIDTGNNRVQRVSPDGDFMYMFGGFGLASVPGSETWWWLRIPWLLALMVTTFAVVALFSRFETQSKTAKSAGSATQVIAGAVLACGGLIFLALGGIISDTGAGVRILPFLATICGIILILRPKLMSG